jgi:hypothetical protein
MFPECAGSSDDESGSEASDEEDDA